MEILRVIQFYSPQCGGSVKSTKNIVKNLYVFEDLNTKLLTTNMINKKEKEKKPTILKAKRLKIFKFKPIFQLGYYYFTPQMVCEILKENYDIVHLHCCRNFQTDLVLFLFSLIRKRIPIIINTHGTLSVPETSNVKRFVKKIYDLFIGKFLLNRVTLFIASSKLEYVSLKEKLRRKNIISIPHGMDLSINIKKVDGKNFRKKYALSDSTKIISYIGRIYESKGIQYIIQAIPYIKDQIQDFKVIIAGADDGYLDNLKRLISKLKVQDFVIFTGYLSKEDNSLWELYEASDIIVSPSNFESFGHMILESIYFKKPIIYSNPFHEILENNKSGIYIPYSNFRSLSHQLIKLIEDDELVKKLTTNAINSIKKFPNWSSVIKKYYKIYQFLSK